MGAGRDVDALARYGLAPLIACLTVSAVLLTLFDDLNILREEGGSVAGSPAWIPLLGASLCVGRAARAKLPWRPLRWILLVLLVTTVTSLLYVIIVGEAASPLATQKTVRLAANWCLILAAIIGAWFLSRTNPGLLAVSAALALTILLGIALIQIQSPQFLDGVGPIHAVPNIQQRVRATRFEASSLGGAALVLSAIACVRIPRRSGVVCFIALITMVQAITQSRGTLLVYLMAISLCFVFLTPRGDDTQNHTGARGGMVKFLPLILIAFSFAYGAILASDWWTAAGVSSGTSDAARAVWSTVSASSLQQYPLGLGFAAYLDVTPDLLRNALILRQAEFGSAAFAELAPLSIPGGSDDLLSPKNLPNVAALYFGLPGILLLAWIYWKAATAVCQLSESPMLALAFSVLVMVQTTYFFTLVAWEQALLAGVLLARVQELGANRSANEVTVHER